MNERKLFKNPLLTEAYRKKRRHEEREKDPHGTLARMHKAQEKRNMKNKKRIESSGVIMWSEEQYANKN